MNHDLNKATVYLYLREEDLERAIENALKKALDGQIQKSAEDDLLNVDQAAVVVHLKKQTVYQLCTAKKIPHYKRNKRLYFKKSELLSWIEEGKQKTQSELTDEMMDYLRRKK